MTKIFDRGAAVSRFLGRGWLGATRRGRLASGVTLSLVASLVTVIALPVAATAAVPKATCPVSRPDQVSASITARLCGGKVRVDGDESSTTEVYALPDGTFQASTAMAAQRVRQTDGSWAPVDLTMTQNVDGSVAPVRSAFPVSLSGAQGGAGVHALATVGSGAGHVAVGWTGVLPQPVLSGNTATYPDVRPGVDVVVSANASGIEQNIVVKNRAAVAQVQGLSLPLLTSAGDTFASDAAGGIAFRDSKGTVFARTPAMRMWDATIDPATKQPFARPLAATFAKRTSTSGGAGVNLGLAPNALWLNDPARVFPITLDPSINPESTTFDTFVEQGSSTDFSGDNDLQFGTTSGNVTRSFLSWDMTQLEHATITSATVNFFNFFSQSCTAAQWDLWLTSTANTTPATTWATQPAGITLESSSTATKGFSSSCDDGWISISGTSFFQAAANTGASRGYMELRAHDESSTSIGFKQVRSRNAADPSQVPYAVVTYTSTPVIGTRSTSPSVPCATGSSTPYLASKMPTLKTQVSQGSGATSTVNFEWWNSTGTTKIGGASPSGVASGSTATATVPSGAFTEGTTYEWRVDAVSGGVTSAWSSWCAFIIDTTAPSTAPTVSSTTYPANTWAGSTTTAGTFTLGAAGGADVNSYLWGLDTNPPPTAAAASALGGGASVTLTPPSNGPHTLYVQSVDRAGNKSAVTSYTFNVGAAAVTSPTTGAISAGLTQMSAAAPSGTTGVTYQWRRADTDAWVSIPTGDVTYTSTGGAVSSWPVPISGGSYPTLNWKLAQTLASSNGAPGLVGRWKLNETAGTTAADSSGFNHPGTTTEVTWDPDDYPAGHNGCALFDGSSQITTAEKPNTLGNFSVSAWVWLDDPNYDRAVLSGTSAQQPGFDLTYEGGHWEFSRPSADVTDEATWYAAVSGAGTDPVLETWTHLVGTYEAATGEMTLYVNGVVASGTVDPTPFQETGGIVIGRDEWDSAPSQWWHGAIADAQIFNTALAQSQVTALYNGSPLGSGTALAGPLQTRAVFTGGGAPSTPETDFTYDPNLATAATSNVGPGAVNLVTGNLVVSASDVSVSSYGSDLTTARTFNTRQAGVFDGTHMFGPGWASTATVATADAPYTALTVTGTLVQVGLPDGSTIGFTAATTAGKFVPQVGDEGLTLTYTSGSNSYTLTDQDANIVVFTHISGATTGLYAPTSVTEPGSGQTTTMTWAIATVDGVPVIRPTQLLAPVPAGVTCTTLVKGCRALTFAYATTTSATGTTQAGWGDYTGRVQKISFTAWDPATSAMKTVAVAQYDYDSNGRLTAQWDPRLDNGVVHLWTTYTYNIGDGTLATITPNTQPAWTLTYTTIPGDSGAGRLASVSRSALTAGTATSTVVYNVPRTGTSGPYDMSVGQTARWNEQAAPVQATAIFDPGQVPTGNQTTGVMPSSWTRATVTYMDANSRDLNTVTPGGYTTTNWYDQFGNVTQSLTANNRAEALNTSSTDTTAQEQVLANTYSTYTHYSADGTQAQWTTGPYHQAVLADGTPVIARDTTHYTYDAGAPSGTCPCGLVTTQIGAVMYWSGGTPGTGTLIDGAEPRTTTTTYDWTLRQPLVVTVDPTGLALTTTTAYDTTTGLTTSVTTPAGGATTNTPATTLTTYYSTAANGTYPECGLHPEWANLVCRSQPGGQPSAGPELPVKVVTYDMFDSPTMMSEKTSVGTLRTTTFAYDQAERGLSETVVASFGTAVPKLRDVYDPATGLLTNVQSLDSGGSVIAQTTTAYDGLGRITSYTDADNVQSTYAYDLLSRVATVSDGLQNSSVAYDSGGEQRGLPTQLVDPQAGTITGSYDADGNLVSEAWPNGIVVAHAYNEDGVATGITYTKSGCGQPDCTIYTQVAGINASGNVAGYTSSFSAQTYGYDLNDRLTKVTDMVGGQCSTRVYGFDATAAGKAGDRTSLTSYDPAANGSCQTATAAASTAWTYDTANRINTAGYAYDALGRTITVPAADTQSPDSGNMNVAYNENDIVHSVQQGDQPADVYTLDVDNQRVRSWTDAGGVKHVNHYSASGDRPSWIADGTDAMRMIMGLDGFEAINTTIGGVSTLEWQIIDLHGDVVALTAGTAIDVVMEADEFGKLRTSSQVGTLRYGWEGQAQRAGDNPSGLLFMGARMYNPGTGSFLSADPIHAAAANDYGYCSGDGVNCQDLSGESPCWHNRVHWGFLHLSVRVDVSCHISDGQVDAIIFFGHKAAQWYGLGAAITAIVPGVGWIATAILAVVSFLIEAIVDTFDHFYNRWCNHHGITFGFRMGFNGTPYAYMQYVRCG